MKNPIEQCLKQMNLNKREEDKIDIFKKQLYAIFLFILVFFILNFTDD